MYSKLIYNEQFCHVCYFRTVADMYHKKILLQLTEKCNLRCEHCFVSSSTEGIEMNFDSIRDILLPKMIEASVKKVTLTGGEPFMYNSLLDVINLLNHKDIEVSVCTNASMITEKFLNEIKDFDTIHFNVSLDGFTNNSHGRFRGNKSENLFKRIIDNICSLGERNFLNGILVTPNNYATIDEYIQLCEFAIKNKAKYVLMNPLSQFGRGEDSFQLGFSKEKMIELRNATQQFNNSNFEVVYVRFPNTDLKPLGKCVLGKTPYVFSNGDIAICPYIVFATNDKVSKYNSESFIIGNAFESKLTLDEMLKKYSLPIKTDGIYTAQKDINNCNTGCYAAKISSGHFLHDPDYEFC